MSKPILCLDFDGVIHSYVSGWINESTIPDPLVPGAIEFMLEAAKVFKIAVFSSRGRSYDGRRAMRKYLTEGISSYLHKGGYSPTLATSWDHAREWLGTNVDFPDQKPSAFVTLDDRAITFCGRWPSIQELLDFKPWTKQPAPGPFAYTSKPTHIEAFLWTGQSNTDAATVPMWFCDAVLTGVIRAELGAQELSIKITPGIVRCGLDVYLIRDITTGEIYPCDPETFERKYRKA